MSELLDIRLGITDQCNPKLGVIIPSYCDANGKWREYLIEKHLPSYEYIKNIDNIIFSYNLQNYSDQDFELAVDCIRDAMRINPTWSGVIQKREGYAKDGRPASMGLVRRDTASAIDNCEIFLYLDDDVVFHDLAGVKYAEILAYMNHFPNCGAIMSAGFLGGYTYGDRIKLSATKHMWTNRGLFIRNIESETGNLLYSRKYMDNYPGGFEDLIPIIELSRKGYFLATSFNNNTFHKSRGMDDKQKKSASKADRYNDIDEICNADYSLRLVRDYLNTEFDIILDTYEVSKFHKFLKIIYQNYYVMNCKDGENAYLNPDKYEIDPKSIMSM